MATKLISTLNALAHLTPDEIVANLSDTGWVKGSDFDAVRHARWKGRQCRVWFYPGRSRPASSGDCSIHHFEWSLNRQGQGIDGLINYYFILLEHFTGEYPNVD